MNDAKQPQPKLPCIFDEMNQFLKKQIEISKDSNRNQILEEVLVAMERREYLGKCWLDKMITPPKAAPAPPRETQYPVFRYSDLKHCPQCSNKNHNLPHSPDCPAQNNTFIGSLAGEAAQPGKPYIAHCQKCGELLECPQCIQMPDGRVISNRDGRLAVSTPPAQPIDPDTVPDLYRLAYMPGVFRCPKCEFQLVRSTISAASGNIIGTTERDRQSDPCPNDGTMMVHVTYKEALDGVTQRLTEVLDERLTPPVASAQPEPVIDYIHRQIEKRERYLRELSDKDKCADNEFDFAANEMEWLMRLISDRTALSPAQAVPNAKGIYVASRASIPARGQMWRELRDSGTAITSSWIDEDGEGETADFSELWARITREISESSALVLYAEEGDLPLKGALIEAGIAIGMGKRVVLCLPGVALDPRNYRPIGSWAHHPLVSRDNILSNAIALALREPSAQAVAAEPCEDSRIEIHALADEISRSASETFNGLTALATAIRIAAKPLRPAAPEPVAEPQVLVNREQLKGIEFSGVYEGEAGNCPTCGEYQSHKPDCWLGKALGRKVG